MHDSLSHSGNELIKIKDEPTIERDELLSEIAKVRVFDFMFSIIQIFFLPLAFAVNFLEPENVCILDFSKRIVLIQ